MKDGPHPVGVNAAVNARGSCHKTTAAQLNAELNSDFNSCFHQNCLLGAPQGHYLWLGCYRGNFGQSCLCQMLVSVVPVWQILGCGHCETCIILWWVHLHCPPYLKESQYGEASERITTQSATYPQMKHGGSSVMVLAATSWHSLGPIFVLDGHFTSRDYRTILEDHVHPMVQTLYCCVAGWECTNTHGKTGDRMVWRTWK